MQRALVVNWPGLQARLLVRAGAGQETWMETYARPRDATHDAAGIDGALEAAIAAAALTVSPLIDGERHVETFDAVSPR